MQLGVAEAFALQEKLRGLVDTTDHTTRAPRHVAGLDVAYDGDEYAAAVVVLEVPELLVLDGEIVGKVLRTQNKTTPVFVSVGHRVALGTAVERVLELAPRYRLPETTRAADRACRDALNEETG